NTLPNHLNDGPEQLKHWCKIILHKRNNSVEDNLNALPPQRDNQLNPVKHRNRNVLPQPPEHSTDSVKHGLNDRQHIRLEPRNHGLNREHDPVPGDLDYVPQPFSARSNTIPNGLHNRPQNVTEPITNRSHSNLNSRPRRVNTVTEPANLLVHENEPSNKKRHGGNNQTNRVSLNSRVTNTQLNANSISTVLIHNIQTIALSIH